MELWEGKLYLFGDDATYMLVLDSLYRPLDRVAYSPETRHRIPKDEKWDIESATIVPYGTRNYLVALSSFSTRQRNRLLAFPLDDLHGVISRTLELPASVQQPLEEVNLEGMALVRNKLVIANRANTRHPKNRFLLVDTSVIRNPDAHSMRIMELVINTREVTGVSGLYYLPQKDLLLLTASQEDTPSATKDGTIKDSFIGWVPRFSEHLQEKTLEVHHLVRLSGVSSKFRKQKIESVCGETEKGGAVLLHLAADNDNGQSSLFTLRLRL